MVHGSLTLYLVGDQDVALVEEEDAELFPRLVGHGGMAIIDDRRPGAENLLVADFAFQHALGNGGDELQIKRHGFAHALHFLQ